MTVGQKLHQTLTGLETAKASLETFALDTQDKNAQKLYADTAGQLEQMIGTLSGRVNYVEQQEPEHAVFNQMKQQPPQRRQ